MKCVLIIPILAVLYIANTYGQQENTDSTKVSAPKPLYVSTGLNYISNITYAGRRDISSVPVLLPNVTLISTSGFFIGVSGYINVASDGDGAEGLSITPGYVFSFNKQRTFGGHVSATKYFFQEDSRVILSAFNATGDLQFYYKPKWFRLALSTSYQIGHNQNDLINSLELAKEVFLWRDQKGKNLSINPNVTLMAGTQSFSETYYTQTVQRRSILNPSNGLLPILPGEPSETIIEEVVTEEQQRTVRQYRPLALTTVLPLAFQANKFRISVTPYVIQPFNEAGLSASDTFFMFTAGVSYLF